MGLAGKTRTELAKLATRDINLETVSYQLINLIHIEGEIGFHLQVELDMWGANMKGSNSTGSETFGYHPKHRGFITQLSAKCGMLVFRD